MANGDYESDHGRRDELFIQESGPGHVPGQRWSGGYGGDRDRGSSSGPGFTGNDFDGRTGRHFGNAVDRGGRPASNGSETAGRDSWGLGRTAASSGAPASGREGLDQERGPHWGKGPKGYQRNDERTREDVCDAIAYQGRIDATEVEVKVENGVVTLSGTVALRDHKRALERLVEGCRGVHEVHNELRLAPEATREPTPSASNGNPDKNART